MNFKTRRFQRLVVTLVRYHLSSDVRNKTISGLLAGLLRPPLHMMGSLPMGAWSDWSDTKHTTNFCPGFIVSFVNSNVVEYELSTDVFEGSKLIILL